MKPKNRHRLLFVCLIFSAILLSAKLLLSQHSAVVVMRWFLRETGIPLQIRKAAWNYEFRQLFRGEIKSLEVDVHYEPLKMDFSLKTPVRYIRKGKEWAIRLEPILKITGLPPTEGIIDLKIFSKKYASAQFDLHQSEPLKLAFNGSTIESPQWNLKASLNWDPINKPANQAWQAFVHAMFEQVKFTSADQKTIVTVPIVSAKQKIVWPDRPPFPMQLSGTLHLSEATVLSGPVFFQEKNVNVQNSLQMDDGKIKQFKIALDEAQNAPINLNILGDVEPNKTHLDVEMSADLKKLLQDRLASWLEPIAPVLTGAKANGRIKMKGKFDSGQTQNTGAAILEINAKSLEFPARQTKIENFDLKMPLSLDEENNEWGTLKIQVVDFHSIKLKKLKFFTHADPGGVYISTEDEKDRDHPLRQFLWGGEIDISKLYAAITSKNGFEIAMAVKGGPFDLKNIQEDLCLSPENPIKGSLSFFYPQLVQDKDSLHLVGDTNVQAFNGTAHMGDLHLDLSESEPRLMFNIDWNDLDLHAIGEWTKIGDISGSLNGYFKNAKMYLTSHGVFPYSYELKIQGVPRGGREIRFYGRAIDNVLHMFGVDPDALGTFGKLGLWFFKTWRNISPSIVHYMGFIAKANADWTELQTFDPEYDSASNYKSYCDVSKNRFLLCGERFTITLNTRGVNPTVLKTESFHYWLADKVNNLKRSIQNDPQNVQKNKNPPTTPTCKPLW